MVVRLRVIELTLGFGAQLMKIGTTKNHIAALSIE